MNCKVNDFFRVSLYLIRVILEHPLKLLSIFNTLRCVIAHFQLLRGMIAIYLQVVRVHQEYRVVHALSSKRSMVHIPC